MTKLITTTTKKIPGEGIAQGKDMLRRAPTEAMIDSHQEVVEEAEEAKEEDMIVEMIEDMIDVMIKKMTEEMTVERIAETIGEMIGGTMIDIKTSTSHHLVAAKSSMVLGEEVIAEHHRNGRTRKRASPTSSLKGMRKGRNKPMKVKKTKSLMILKKRILSGMTKTTRRKRKKIAHHIREALHRVKGIRRGTTRFPKSIMQWVQALIT
jgi:hypothetical protein